MADPEVDLFAGMKKKKKKQVVMDDTPEPAPEPAVAEAPQAVVEPTPEPAAPIAPPAVVEVAEPEADLPEDSSGVATPAEEIQPAEDGGDLFADMKKKKKKKKKEIPMDLVSGVSAIFVTASHWNCNTLSQHLLVISATCWAIPVPAVHSNRLIVTPSNGKTVFALNRC